MPLELPLAIEWVSRPIDRQPRAILGYSIQSDYLTPADAWEVTLADTDPVRLQDLALEPVRLSLHGAQQLLGWVETIARGNGNREVVIRGRDHVSRMLECDADPQVEIKDSMTLGDTITHVAAPCGISVVQDAGDYTAVRNVKTGRSGGTVSSTFRTLKPGDLKPDDGQSVFEFLHRLAARHGVTIQPGLELNTVVLSEPNYKQQASHQIKVRWEGPSNVVSSSSEENYSSFPTLGLASGKIAKAGERSKSTSNEYDVLAELESAGATALTAKLSNKIVSERRTPKSPSALGEKVYRLLYLTDKMARTPDQVRHSVARAVSERLKDSLQYTCEIAGHLNDYGGVFGVDTIIDVQDETCDISEPLWVSGVHHTCRGADIRTQLTCLRPGSLVL